MNINDLVSQITNSSECTTKQSVGLPYIPANLSLPEDVAIFYSLCGGMDLFPSKEYGISIVKPTDFVRANTAIIGEDIQEETQDDRSYNWFVIATDQNGQYITIDLDSNRLGVCYDSFWDRHGVAGSNPIIARNFTELLENLFDEKGSNWYWLNTQFSPLGDAYD